MRKALCFLVLLMAVLPNTLQAQNNEQPDPAPNNDGAQLITIHTNSIKLDLMFQLVSAHTGYRFIINDQVATQLESSVKIIAANGLTFPRDAAFNVLQALLKQRDQPLILMPFGDDTPTSVRFYEVVQVANAIQSMRDEDVIILDDIADFQDVGAGYVTLVAKLKHMRPTDMQNALRAFSTTQTSLRGVQPVGQNMILIADYASNVRRIGKMISLLDSAGSAPRLDVVHVRHMDAVELATAVEELITERVALIGQLDGNAGPQRLSSDAEAVSITIAPNSNSLIIQGLDAGIERVRALVERLDVKIPGIETTRGRIHRYKVKNVLASELQATLTALVGQNLEFRTTDGQLPGPGEEPVPTLPIGSSSFSDFPPVIEFDDNTQQLLIIAKPSDYVELLRVIEALDVRRPQAMIEAAILEVRKDNDFTFGAEVAFIEGSGSGTRVNGGTVFGFSDIVDEAGVPINTGGGEPVGRSPIFGTGGILTFNSGGPFDIPLLLRFLQSQSDVNVLSVPRVMANDNEQAVIAIETDVATLSSNSDGGVVGQNFDYETDGITLTVTPQISDDNYVTLEIDLDVSQFTGQPAIQGAPPPRTRRQITTFVTVPNDQTVIIGGLTSTQTSHAVTKMPFLGDIPVLGELFKTETSTTRDTNLYIFIRPQVFRDRNFSDLKKESNETREEAKSKLEKDPKILDWFEKNADKDERSGAGRQAGKVSRVAALEEIPESE